MINPKELRIGNWVGHDASWSTVNESEKEGIVFQWDDSHFYHICESTMDYDSLIPIPLTTLTLAKLGFKKQNVLHNGTVSYSSKIGPYLYFYDGSAQISIKTPSIKYLHQLQNLYYALTGEELIYKP